MATAQTTPFEVSQAWKDLFSQQLRATYTVVEQGISLSRKAADYWTAQAEEAFKFQQQAVKFSVGVADDLRKTAFEAAEKVVKA